MGAIKIVASVEKKKIVAVSNEFFVFGEQDSIRTPNGLNYMVMKDLTRANLFAFETIISLSGGHEKFDLVDGSYYAAREQEFLSDPVDCSKFFNPGFNLYEVQEKFVGFTMKHVYGKANAQFWDKPIVPASGIFNTSDPGTGKTPTTMAVALKHGCLKNLIVAPLALTQQWESELKKFLKPQYRGHLMVLPRYQEHQRVALLETWKTQPSGWLMLGYAAFRAHYDLLSEIGFDCTIFDESAAICNPKAEVTRSAIEYAANWDNCRFIQLLNGTPVRNSAGDAWAQLNASRNIMVMGETFEEFFDAHTEKKQIQIEKGPRIIKYTGIKNIWRYSAKMAANMGRISRDSKNFPTCTENIVSLPMEEDEEAIYRALEMYGNSVEPGRSIVDLLNEEGVSDGISEFALRRKEMLSNTEGGGFAEFLDSVSTRFRDEEEFDTDESDVMDRLRNENEIAIDLERINARINIFSLTFKGTVDEEKKKAILEEMKPVVARRKELEKELKESQDELSRLQKLIDRAARQERINTMMRLMRASGGFESVFDNQGKRHFVLQIKTKMNWLIEFLEEREANHTQTVVFCIFNAEIDEISRQLVEKGITHGVVRGDTIDVFDTCERFRNEELSVLLVQQAKGDKGLNLQVARDCVFYSKGYSSEKFVQAKARLDRIGSKHDEVDYWYPQLELSDGSPTMDHIIHQAVLNKISLMRAVSVTTSTKVPQEVMDLAKSNPELLERLQKIFPSLTI